MNINGELERELKVKKVLQLVKKMAIPSYRKSSTSTDNMRWLKRNLYVANRNHPNFNEVMDILNKIV